MKFVVLSILGIMAGPVMAEQAGVNFGDNSSEWANDGECDDRRFYGSAMAQGLDRDDIGKDANDCKRGYDSGRLKVWDFARAKAATQCQAINFGDNKSDWPNDGKCDDYRFDGPGADHVLLREDIGHDASDCRKLCSFGQIALRDY